MSETPKLVWKRSISKPLTLYANLKYNHGSITATGLSEKDLLPVQQWCETVNCGTRMSFDMFKFNTESEITAFLLVWG